MKKNTCILNTVCQKQVLGNYILRKRVSVIVFNKMKNERFYKLGGPYVDAWAMIVFKVLRKITATP